MTWARRVGAAALAVAALGGQAKAQGWMSSATLNGGQEVPPRATPAFGFGTVWLDIANDRLIVSETWQDLTAPATGAHIHCCAPPGSTAPVAIDFVPNGFPIGSISGSYNHTFDLLADVTYGAGFLSSAGSVTAARDIFVAGFVAGNSYLNIHTSTFPPGEIRGNLASVVATPEPASLALVATGLVGLVGFGARRRRSA